MADSRITADVRWIIRPPEDTLDLFGATLDNPANDEWRQSDTIGPEPQTPVHGPPETDGTTSFSFTVGEKYGGE